MIGKEIRDIFTDIGIVVVVLLLVLPFTCSRRVIEPSDKIVPDTIFIRDTLYVPEPKLTSEKIVGEEVAKLPKAKSELNIPISNELERNVNNELSTNSFPKILDDSVGIEVTDSCNVVLPIHEKVYEDSAYKAVVRGYNPELVSLDIYNSTRTITITKTKQPKVVVGIGPYAGFGNKGFNYGIAVNVSMPIWSW